MLQRSYYVPQSKAFKEHDGLNRLLRKLGKDFSGRLIQDICF